MASTLASSAVFKPWTVSYGFVLPIHFANVYVDTLTNCPQVFGYENNGVWDISTVRQQLISSLMTLGAFISSGGVGLISIYLSRRASIWVAIVLCFVANIMMISTTSIAALYIGRLLIGLANGMLMTFSQLYIQVGPLTS